VIAVYLGRRWRSCAKRLGPRTRRRLTPVWCGFNKPFANWKSP